MTRLLYLDYNATTPVEEEVLEAMLPWFREQYGNPSSRGHAFGWMADEAVETGREEVASLFATNSEAVTFTSGATEALNLAIKGVARAQRRKGAHLVTASSEHSAVLDTHRALEREGFEVSYVDVGADGRVDPGHVEGVLRPDTTLLTVMWANNETGILNPVRALYALAKQRGVTFLSDSTQAVGKIPVDISVADFLTCSAHKAYGPKGVGALIRNPEARRIRLQPILHGGGQEKGLRPGTMNVPGIVGLGRAATVASRDLAAEEQRLRKFRDRFEAELRALQFDIDINGAQVDRLPQTSSVTFRSVPSRELIPRMRDLAVSTGSACASGSGRPSHVLKAMGLSDAEAMATVRFSFGRYSTEEDVDRAVDAVRQALEGSPAA